MTDLHIKVEPELAREFKDISREDFHGDDAKAFQQAVRLLRLLRGGNHFEYFWEIADNIRNRVEEAGGLSEDEIDRIISEARASTKPRAA